VYVSQALIFSFSSVGLPASGATGARGLRGRRIVWTSVLRFLLPLDGVTLSVDPWLKFCTAPGSVRGGWKAAAVARRQRSVASLGMFF
jgi:hypothetical protein